MQPALVETRSERLHGPYDLVVCDILNEMCIHGCHVVPSAERSHTAIIESPVPLTVSVD
jgi:hypothetical protein